MKNSKKYKYCKVLSEIFSNDAHCKGNTLAAASFRMIDFNDEEERELFSCELKDFIKVCQMALKELGVEDDVE